METIASVSSARATAAANSTCWTARETATRCVALQPNQFEGFDRFSNSNAGDQAAIQHPQNQGVGKQQQQKPPPNSLHISTNANDSLNGTIASLSPNARVGTFTPPHTKNHRVVAGHAGQPTFQHPMQRPVSVQIPRQAQIQQRMMQSPFSPQTPQSPHDQFPLSPATSNHEPFSRPASECSQDPYLNVSRFRFPSIPPLGQYLLTADPARNSRRRHHVRTAITVQRPAPAKVQRTTVQPIK